MTEYSVRLDNAKEIARRMSHELEGELIVIAVDMSSKVRFGHLDNSDWSGGCKLDPLPVKATDIQLLWSCANYLYTVPYGRGAYINFVAPGIVLVEVQSASGQRCSWTFISKSKQAGG